jgi:hypothetical protein
VHALFARLLARSLGRELALSKDVRFSPSPVAVVNGFSSISQFRFLVVDGFSSLTRCCIVPVLSVCVHLCLASVCLLRVAVSWRRVNAREREREREREDFFGVSL